MHDESRPECLEPGVLRRSRRERSGGCAICIEEGVQISESRAVPHPPGIMSTAILRCCVRALCSKCCSVLFNCLPALRAAPCCFYCDT
eukprot:365050-Chlamydomonas_euryale.AAC.4